MAKTAKERAAERRAAMKATTMPAAAPAEDPPAARAPATAPIDARPTRTTLVLAPLEYRALRRFVADTEEQTGLRGVAASEVCRVLLNLMTADDDLAMRVREQLVANGGNRRHG